MLKRASPCPVRATVVQTRENYEPEFWLGFLLGWLRIREKRQLHAIRQVHLREHRGHSRLRFMLVEIERNSELTVISAGSNEMHQSNLGLREIVQMQHNFTSP
jgi:hypothetical protein